MMDRTPQEILEDITLDPRGRYSTTHEDEHWTLRMKSQTFSQSVWCQHLGIGQDAYLS